MKLAPLIVTLVAAASLSFSTASAQEPPRAHYKETQKLISKKPKQQCKTVITKEKDRFGRQLVKREKVCR